MSDKTKVPHWDQRCPPAYFKDNPIQQFASLFSLMKQKMREADPEKFDRIQSLLKEQFNDTRKTKADLGKEDGKTE